MRQILPSYQGKGALSDIFGIFPRLADRLSHYGNQLSGGEQQMLAVGQAKFPCWLASVSFRRALVIELKPTAEAERALERADASHALYHDNRGNTSR